MSITSWRSAKLAGGEEEEEDEEGGEEENENFSRSFMGEQCDVWQNIKVWLLHTHQWVSAQVIQLSQYNDTLKNTNNPAFTVRYFKEYK